MTIERLRTILSAYGANPARWPASERAKAEALIARSAEARDALVEARALDATLDRAITPVPYIDPVALAAAASASPQEKRKGGAARRLWWLEWSPLAGLVAAGIVGLVIGLSGLTGHKGNAHASEATVSLFSQEVEPW